MKKLILITCMSVTSAVAFGQAVQVFFSNDPVTLTNPPDRLIRFGDGTGELQGRPAIGTNFQVQLYYGAITTPESSMISVTNVPGRLRVASTTIPGVWTGIGDRYLLGFSYGSGSLNLQVRVWDIAWGSTYEEALANPNYQGLYGKSLVFEYAIPPRPGIFSDPEEFYMHNFKGFDIQVIPEPSSIALTGLGGVVLLFLRRRGQSSEWMNRKR